MFAPGEREVRPHNSGSGEEDRIALAFIRSAFADEVLEQQLQKGGLPRAEDGPPLLLPPGWEQRCDTNSQRIFYVDHNTCSTTWDDPRCSGDTRGSPDEADGEAVSDGIGDDEAAEGAATDLAALSVGVTLPDAEEQLKHWIHAVERNAHCALKRVSEHHRSAADISQCPRFMLVQTLHRAVVRQLLSTTPSRRAADSIDERRRRMIISSGAQMTVPKEAFATLTKHSSAGLTKTYKNRAFAPSKLNLRKVRKVLTSLIPAPTTPLPACRLTLPSGMSAQLISILLFPPGTLGAPDQVATSGVNPDGVWGAAADATMALSLVTGSLSMLLQLPRATYCRSAQVGAHSLMFALEHHPTPIATLCVPTSLPSRTQTCAGSTGTS
jgi:hypothetical protein